MKKPKSVKDTLDLLIEHSTNPDYSLRLFTRSAERTQFWHLRLPDSIECITMPEDGKPDFVLLEIKVGTDTITGTLALPDPSQEKEIQL